MGYLTFDISMYLALTSKYLSKKFVLVQDDGHLFQARNGVSFSLYYDCISKEDSFIKPYIPNSELAFMIFAKKASVI